MFRCVPCLNGLSSKSLLEGLARHSEFQAEMGSEGEQETMEEATKRLKKKRREKKRQTTAGDGSFEEEGGEEDEEWVAEVERGVLLNLVSEPGGRNRIDKIRFRKDLFDVEEAHQWWTANCDKVIDLYCAHCPHPPPSSHLHAESSRNLRKDGCHGESSSGAKSVVAAPPGRLVEWVVEDQPGVFVTIRSLPDGQQELRRVEISREMYGEVKARVWWEENKARLRRQYARPN
ncbi:protein Brevis radix-like 1 [Wolffia australiana]